jgi:hypothetical protein
MVAMTSKAETALEIDRIAANARHSVQETGAMRLAELGVRDQIGGY